MKVIYPIIAACSLEIVVCSALADGTLSQGEIECSPTKVSLEASQKTDTFNYPVETPSFHTKLYHGPTRLEGVELSDCLNECGVIVEETPQRKTVTTSTIAKRERLNTCPIDFKKYYNQDSPMAMTIDCGLVGSMKSTTNTSNMVMSTYTTPVVVCDDTQKVTSNMEIMTVVKQENL